MIDKKTLVLAVSAIIIIGGVPLIAHFQQAEAEETEIGDTPLFKVRTSNTEKVEELVRQYIKNNGTIPLPPGDLHKLMEGNSLNSSTCWTWCNC